MRCKRMGERGGAGIWGQLCLQGLCAPSIQMSLGLGQPVQGLSTTNYMQGLHHACPSFQGVQGLISQSLACFLLLHCSSRSFSFCGCVLMNVCFPWASRGIHFAHPRSLVQYLAHSRCSANAARNMGESYAFILGPPAGRMTLLSWLFGVRWLGRGVPGRGGTAPQGWTFVPSPPLLSLLLLPCIPPVCSQ